jgi:hypothetical protein
MRFLLPFPHSGYGSLRGRTQTTAPCQSSCQAVPAGLHTADKADQQT